MKNFILVIITFVFASITGVAKPIYSEQVYNYSESFNISTEVNNYMYDYYYNKPDFKSIDNPYKLTISSNTAGNIVTVKTFKSGKPYTIKYMHCIYKVKHFNNITVHEILNNKNEYVFGCMYLDNSGQSILFKY